MSNKPQVTAYLNPMCPWTRGVIEVLRRHQLDFDYRDVIRDPAAHQEMVTKSRQYASPCVEVDGHMLADVGGDEVEAWLRQHGYLDG